MHKYIYIINNIKTYNKYADNCTIWIMSDHYFDLRKGSLVEFYLKEIIVGVSKQIKKEYALSKIVDS